MTTTIRASHLLDEPPIMVYPSLAKAIGINQAIVLQQLHWLLNATERSKNKYNFVDGRWWVYNTYAEWQEYFCWLSVPAIKTLFLQLERDGFILTQQGVKKATDRRKWYTIDYETWNKFSEGIKSIPSSDKIYPMNGQILSHTMPESGLVVEANEPPETTTETTTEKENLSAATAPGAARAKSSPLKKTCRLLSKSVQDDKGQNPYWNTISCYSFKTEWSSFTDAEKRVHQGRIQQILKALDGLDQEKVITPEELVAAYGWFRQTYPDADFPAGADSVARMLTNYRATHRSKSNGHRNNGSSKKPNPNCPVCEGKGWYRAENGRDYSCNCEEAIHEQQPTH